MLQEPKLSRPDFLDTAAEAVEKDASEVDTLTSVLLSKAAQEDGELRTEHVVDVLVVVLRAKDCGTVRGGHQEWRRVSGALAGLGISYGIRLETPLGATGLKGGTVRVWSE